MSNCEVGIIKPYAENLLFTSIKCRYCKARFEQLNYRQYYCNNEECKRLRRRIQQRAYRQHRKGLTGTPPQLKQELSQ
jgi:hypothetical protein